MVGYRRPLSFVESLAAQSLAETEHRPRLLLLGAFPNGDFARDQVAPAVHAASVTWMRLGGDIVCGGHPTFVPLLAEAARLVGRDALVVFQSAFYVSPLQADELSRHAQLVMVPAEGEPCASLTAMRRRMVAEGGACAVLAVGGHTDEGGNHEPGIEEEIRLARIGHVPVYVLGAPGGQAALITAREAAASTPWSGLGNALDNAANAMLRETDAYEEAVRLIWQTLSPK